MFCKGWGIQMKNLLVITFAMSLMACSKQAAFNADKGIFALKSEKFQVVGTEEEESIKDDSSSFAGDDNLASLTSGNASQSDDSSSSDDDSANSSDDNAVEDKKEKICVHGLKFQVMAGSAKCKGASSSSGKKVNICHIPAGNPDAKHDICIARDALPAHLEKSKSVGDKDYLGSCIK